MRKSLLLATAVAALSLPCAPATAGTINGWNLGNVLVESGPYLDDMTYFSTVYDRDDSGGMIGATTNGRVSFEPPTGAAPGIKVINDEPFPGMG